MNQSPKEIAARILEMPLSELRVLQSELLRNGCQFEVGLLAEDVVEDVYVETSEPKQQPGRFPFPRS